MRDRAARWAALGWCVATAGCTAIVGVSGDYADQRPDVAAHEAGADSGGASDADAQQDATNEEPVDASADVPGEDADASVADALAETVNGDATSDANDGDSGVDVQDGAADADAPALDASHCGNGVVDGDETDIDCGGPTCQKCLKFRHCLQDSDCYNFCNLTTMKCG